LRLSRVRCSQALLPSRASKKRAEQTFTYKYLPVCATAYWDFSYLCSTKEIKKQTTYKNIEGMSKKFVIGDRTKDEWISVLDTEKKKLEFTNHLASAKEYILEEDAQQNLQKIQETGYFSDLQIYMKEDNKAYKVDERDTF